MTDLIALLTLYYTCDTAVALAPERFPKTYRVQCIGHYENVKSHFMAGPAEQTGSPRAARQKRAAYLAFKAWEQENAPLVHRMRAQARADLRN